MFCPKCGLNCKDASFCPKCGADLRGISLEGASIEPTQFPPLQDPYLVDLNGEKVDLNKIIRMYGTGIRKAGAYAYLQSKFHLSKQYAKEILDPIYAAHSDEKISFSDGLKSQLLLEQDSVNQERANVSKMEATGQVYCPKCHSTSVTAQKKGFGFVRGAVGAAVGLDIGLIAGGAGANKIKLVCMKCGHEWKPGKK